MSKQHTIATPSKTFETYEKKRLMSHKVGAKRGISSVKEFSEGIDHYLNWIAVHNSEAKDAGVNDIVYPTIEGLELTLGVDLNTYTSDEEYAFHVRGFKKYITSYTLQNILNKEKYSPGQVFYLKNVNKEYKDKVEVENTTNHVFSLKDLHKAQRELEEVEVVEWEEPSQELV